MKSLAILLFFALSLLAPQEALGQDLSLPPGAETTWIVEGAEEIIAHFVFDVEAVAERLPEGMAFLTLSELSSAGNEAARAHVAANPAQAEWGISFLEIVRSEVFEIDGRGPTLAEDGAFALWFAGVKPTDGSDLPPGRLALELWVPDPEFSEYMRKKGHYASHGDVRLTVSEDGTWRGSIEVDDLRVYAICSTAEEARPLGPGSHLIYPRADSEVSSVVRSAYAGHMERSCTRDDWRVSGTHPVATASRVAGGVFQFGYTLRGGAYTQ